MTSSLRDTLSGIPEGYSEGTVQHRRYRLEKTTFNDGRSLKFYARELGGTDFVSLNLYFLATGELLKPCEMPEDKVRTFLHQLVPLA